MSKHTELLDKIKPLLADVVLPPGATRLQINDCSEHSYSLLVSLKMGARPYMLYKHDDRRKPYMWLEGNEASHPDTKSPYQMQGITRAAKRALNAIPGIRVLRHVPPKLIFNWDSVERKLRKEGYDRSYIEFDVEFYPQD